MKRTRANRLLVLTALFHLFTDVALGGGAVLCVGPNEHKAIEVGHLAPGCEAIGDTRAVAIDAGFATEECMGCTDSPLHSEPEMASKEYSWNPSSPAVVSIAFQAHQPLTHSTELQIAPRAGFSPTMRALRSTVLII